MIAAYTHRALDETVSRIADMLFSFPPVLLGLLVTAILSPGIHSAVAAIVLITLPAMVRVVRAATLDIARRDFVIVAEVAGASFGRRLFIHLLPNTAGVVAVQTAYSISLGMLIESALSFLGLGVQPPSASLGSLLREGALYLDIAPWLAFGPGALLAAAILSVNLFGDGLRAIVDPSKRDRCASGARNVVTALVAISDLVVDFRTRQGPVRALDGAVAHRSRGREGGPGRRKRFGQEHARNGAGPPAAVQRRMGIGRAHGRGSGGPRARGRGAAPAPEPHARLCLSRSHRHARSDDAVARQLTASDGGRVRRRRRLGAARRCRAA